MFRLFKTKSAERPGADIQATLRVLADNDSVRQPQIDMLDRAFQAAADQGRAADQILRFFMANPAQGALIDASALFLTQNPESVALRLAVLASAYASSRAGMLDPAAEELVALWKDEVAHAIRSRVRGLSGAAGAERDALLDGLRQFPDSFLLDLHLIDVHVRGNEIGEANRLIAKHRNRIQAELAEEIAVAQAGQRLLDDAMANQRLVPAGADDIYDEAFCRSMWISYYESYNLRNQRQHGDSLLSAEFQAMVASIATSIDILIDFGSMCAQPLFEAARRHPHIQFFACDRQRLITELNAAAYKLPNLHFRSGDIFDAVAEIAATPGRKALSHVRTTCVMFPHFVIKLYDAARSAGIEYILFMEGAPMSRLTLEFLDFEAMPALSVAGRHKLRIHDYKAILRDAGYRIASFKWIDAPGLLRGFDASSYLGAQYAIVASASH